MPSWYCHLVQSSDPQSYAKAAGHPFWESAMEDEYNSLLENQTWDLVPLPSGRKLVRCKWVYKTKSAADGKITKQKARLVAKGFQQVHGLDYDETFAPVAKMDSIHLVLTIAAAQRWEVHQMDVKNAFLHGDLSEEIYMEQPHGFIQDSSLVCRLKKSLYGLKQAPRAWYAKIDSFLLSQNFEKSRSRLLLLSSAEAEYRGIVNITIQVLWLQRFLTELGVQFHQRIVIWCDNQSTLKFCKDPVQRQRTKHIEIRTHYIRDLVHDRVIDLQFWPSAEQTADILTKTFTEKKFRSLRDHLGVKDTVA
eukprot:PITA_04964